MTTPPPGEPTEREAKIERQFALIERIAATPDRYPRPATLPG